MTNENKRHYIADEKLGGIEREYSESDRNASAGDYIVGIHSGTIYKAYNVGSSGTAFAETSVIAHKGEYRTLSPTDIIRHNGERYRLVDRTAAVGDKIVVTATNSGNMRDVGIGGMYVTTSYDCDGSPVVTDDALDDAAMYLGNFRVLEPVVAEQDMYVTSEHADDTPDLIDKSHPDLIDLVIRLSRTVAELEKRLDTTEQELSAMSDVFENHRDWASYRIGNVRETANNADYKAGQALTTAELQADKPRCCRCY